MTHHSSRLTTLGSPHRRRLVWLSFILTIGVLSPQPLLADTTGLTSIAVEAKLNQLILPQVLFAGATLEEAVEFFTLKAKELDAAQPESQRQPIRIIIHPDLRGKDFAFDFDLKNIPLMDVLRYVAEFGNIAFHIQGDTVEFVPLSEAAKHPLLTRIYQLKAGSADRLGLNTALDQSNSPTWDLPADIPFPEGAAFTFSAKERTLSVRNLPNNMNRMESWLLSKHAWSRPSPGENAELKTLLAHCIEPQVSFSEASLDEAIQFLRMHLISRCDSTAPREIANIILKPGGKTSVLISCDAKDISVLDALHHIARQADHVVRADPHAIVVIPREKK